MALLTFLAIPLLLSVARAASPYSEYILSPTSRTLVPASVYNINGTVINASALTSSPSGTPLTTSNVATFHGASAVTYDFGKNVAGLVSFTTGDVSGADEWIGISFTESNLWINSNGSDATYDLSIYRIDEALWWPVAAGTFYEADKKHQRGGFRYLNVYHNASGTAEIYNLTVWYTATPQLEEEDLASYSGWFHSDDEKLNRIWYAGAYTVELCTIDPTAGDALVFLEEDEDFNTADYPVPWWNNYTITNGTSALVDGAKRDRLVWPGDMAIAVPTIATSRYFMDTIANSLSALLELQNATTGQLPYAGAPFPAQFGNVFSFTYHLYTLVGLYNHWLWTGDAAYLGQNWERFKFALSYSLSYVDDTGMAYVPPNNPDWLRGYMGGHNIEANAILYSVLTSAVQLAAVLNDTSAAVSNFSTAATKLKAAANVVLWDPSANLYRDNDSLPLTGLHPQDGNSWAVVANLTDSLEKKKNISAALEERWGAYGPPAPEAGATVSPFISGFELQAHYLAGNAAAAVRLMGSMWADFMLDDPRMTNSTFIEGYSTDGSLHYIYANDPRVSFAHGWASGPTGILSVHAAGLQLLSAGGAEWRIAPSLGGLTAIDAGYTTAVGAFSVNVTGNATVTEFGFETPLGTSGSVSVESPAGGGEVRITGEGGVVKRVGIPAGMEGRFEVGGLEGGRWSVVVAGN